MVGKCAWSFLTAVGGALGCRGVRLGPGEPSSAVTRTGMCPSDRALAALCKGSATRASHVVQDSCWSPPHSDTNR